MPAELALHEVILIAFLCFVVGAALVWILSNMTILRLRQRLGELEATLAAEQRLHADRETMLDQAGDRLSATFSELSARALHQNNTQFLHLASESMHRQLESGRYELGRKEQAIEQMMKPIREALEKTEKQIRDIENERKAAYGSLEQQLRSMAEAQQQLQSETRNLVQALRRPEVRGQWGELTLRRLVELAGMVDHCDFYEQESVTTENGRLRPDMIVRMPEKREIVVDVKTPLDAYLNAVEAGDDASRRAHLERHAANVRKRVMELAGKAYWSQFERSPEFVVLFIPGEQFLNAAFDIDERLLEEALQKRVIIATPTSLVALLRAVAFGWRQLDVAENAEQIRTLGEDIYRRLSTFGDHLGRLGKSLGSSVDHFNRAVGSLERNVLPGARKFTELGIHNPKPLAELDPLETAVREISQETETPIPQSPDNIEPGDTPAADPKAPG